MSIDPNGRKLLRIEARNAQTPIENAVKTIKELQARKVNIAVITNNGSVTAKSVRSD